MTDQPETTEAHPEPAEPLTPATLQQHLTDLEAWLKARHLVIIPVAQGVRSGRFCELADFLGDGHVPAYTLGQRQP